MSTNHTCRSCGSEKLHPVIDLGVQPLANNLLSVGDLGKPEPMFPLEVGVCGACWLMQINYNVPPVDLFREYVYFSSFSDQMLRHAREASFRYIREKRLDSGSFVVEVASNDGYLLKNFVKEKIPCLGIEPASNIAEVARASGVDTHVDFFGRSSAESVASERGCADLILGNNVFAHAPDTNDFVEGLGTLLAPDGWIVLEFPYGVEMIDKSEFDTIYHEHVFYFTLTPLIPLFARHGLEVFHVERIAIHGGSLRLFAAKRGAETIRTSVSAMLAMEDAAGVSSDQYYQSFRERAAGVKQGLLEFFAAQQAAGGRVAAYGASAKGSTLLNYIGESARTLEFIADRSTYKHGKFSPGIHVPIVPAEHLEENAPDYAVLLVWNFADEVIAQQRRYLQNGGSFVIPIPKLNIASQMRE